MKSIPGKTFGLCMVFLLVTFLLLPPVIDASADVSVQAKEVLETVDKMAPTVEEIAENLWDLSEVLLLEARSSVYLKDLLKNRPSPPNSRRQSD